MRATRLKYRKGDQICVIEGGRRELYFVRGREAGSYVLEPQLEGKQRNMSDEEVLEHRLDGNLIHYPRAPLGLSKEQYALLRQDWGMHPEEYRWVADLKGDYVRAVDHHREHGHTSVEEACKLAAVEVHAANGERWDKALTEIEVSREADKRRTAHLPKDIRDARRGDRLQLVRGYLEPKRPVTIHEWWRLWTKVKRDRKILIPLFADRGNRTPRLAPVNGVDLYEEMRIALRLHYYTKECHFLSTAYKELKKALVKKGVPEDAVSYNAFNDLRKREYGPYEEISEREGHRYARMRLDVARRIHYDMEAMQEIEIDHCLLDVLLVHERTGRLLGRPWLTMAMCRSTRMIVGAHISFDPPCAASVQRCLMHAFWPKDLRGLELKNRWPAEGVPDVIVSDNGKEFHSQTLHSSQLALNFAMRYLPGRMPWLKGTIESCFRTLQIQVLDTVEGKAFLKMRKNSDYDANAEAKMSLPELRMHLLRWIVDDYHVTYHSGIETTPLERWDEKVNPDGVRGVERPDDLLALLGSAHKLKIGDYGVRMYGEHYWHEELSELRRTFGRDFEYEVRSDAYDIGRLLLIVPKRRWVADGEDNDSGRRLEIFSTRPERTMGVSVNQNRVRRRLAAKLQREGVPVTENLLDEAIGITDAQAHAIMSDSDSKTTAGTAARYDQDNGRLLTPVAGRTGSNRPDDPVPVLPAPGLAGTTPTAAATEVATASQDKASTRTKRQRKSIPSPSVDAADALVEDDFEKRFAQMEIMD